MSIKKIIDKNGNPVRLVCSTPTQNQVTKAVYGLIDSGDINLGDGSLTTGKYFMNDTNFKTNAETSLELITTELENYDYSCIPIFGITDTHSSLPSKGTWDLGEYISDIAPSTIMGLFLGDICDTVFSPTYALLNYRHHVDAFKKCISVVGNHDRATNSYLDETQQVTHSRLNKWFYTKGFKRVDDVLYGSYDDEDYNVRYLVLNPYEFVPMENAPSGHLVRMGTKQMSWLIKNLAECDKDIIILMHQMFTDLNIHRDGTIQTWADCPPIFNNIWKMLKDRKNKRTGTITDSDGKTHNYDFSNCKSDLLCTIHGHTHEELYLQDEGLLEYALDYGCQNNCIFASINRVENKIKISQFNSTTVKDTLELSLSGKNSIVNKLTNVTSSNMATTGVDTNSSYTTTLTATSGTLGTITVKMNGVDISSTAVSGNVVTINSVVGRVEITATAS